MISRAVARLRCILLVLELPGEALDATETVLRDAIDRHQVMIAMRATPTAWRYAGPTGRAS